MQKSRKNNRAVGFALSFMIFSLVLAIIGGVLMFISTSAQKSTDTPKAPSTEDTPPPKVSCKMSVVIDAGHGGEDGGTSGKNGVTEKELNLKLAFKLRDILEAKGAEVILTRDEDILLYDRNVDFKGRKKSLDLRARLDIAKNNPNSVFISLHMNSFPDEKYNGLQVWYSGNDSRSKILAENIQSSVKNALQPENNRVTKKAGSDIYLLNRATTPAVLVECGFLSNEEECEALCDEKYQTDLSSAIADAVFEFIK